MQRFDMDQALQCLVAVYLRMSRYKQSLGWHGAHWRSGEPLKLLLAGYNGARNTGADVRVAEMVRQIRHILGPDNSELTVTTLDQQLTEGYFSGARQVTLPYVFPPFLYRECPRHHGVIACEGSMFKSKFADALSTMMTTALAMASQQGKLSVGYGGEAGAMTASLRRFIQNHCGDAFILCRNEASRSIVSDQLGIRSSGGSDTAWTFDPAPPQRGEMLLRNAGWDGKRRLLMVCPINPFWWPVKPDLSKFFGRYLFGLYRKQHHRSLYFHQYPAAAEQRYQRYIEALALAINEYTCQRDVSVVVVGMERLDRAACELLASRLRPAAPLFVSDDYDMYELVSILRHASLLVSSRYHAIVTTMPAQVPSLGITMDERIRNLMEDRGHRDLLLEVDDEQLADKLTTMLIRLEQDVDTVAAQIARAVPRQLQLMGQMGREFADEVERVYPGFPRRTTSTAWQDYLPPLSPSLQRLLEQYA